jgi:hypothetical protein
MTTISKTYCCNLCDYTTDRKLNIDRHLESERHLRRSDGILTEDGFVVEKNDYLDNLSSVSQTVTKVYKKAKKQSKIDKELELAKTQLEIYKLKVKCLEMENGIVQTNKIEEQKIEVKPIKENIKLVIGNESDIYTDIVIESDTSNETENIIKPIEYNEFIKNINEYLKENKYLKNKNDVFYLDLNNDLTTKKPKILYENIITDLFNRIDKHLLPIRCIDSKRQKFSIYDGNKFITVENNEKTFKGLKSSIERFMLKGLDHKNKQFQPYELFNLGLLDGDYIYRSDKNNEFLSYLCGSGCNEIGSGFDINDFIRFLAKVCKY